VHQVVTDLTGLLIAIDLNLGADDQFAELKMIRTSFWLRL